MHLAMKCILAEDRGEGCWERLPNHLLLPFLNCVERDTSTHIDKALGRARAVTMLLVLSICRGLHRI